MTSKEVVSLALFSCHQPKAEDTIVEVKSGKGASAWGRLKSGIGWISLDFVKRV